MATATVLQMVKAVNRQRLNSKLVGGAQEDSGGNLVIQIEVGQNDATIHCDGAEHLSEHSGRSVIFKADKPCTIHFSNKKIFGVESLTLDDSNCCEEPKAIQEVSTSFYITPDANTDDLVQTPPAIRTAPKLFVP